MALPLKEEKNIKLIFWKFKIKKTLEEKFDTKSCNHFYMKCLKLSYKTFTFTHIYNNKNIVKSYSNKNVL